MEHFLLQLFVFLVSATIAVPLAKKFGLGAVLGYLVAGVIIGPYVLNLVGEVEEVMHFTEFGVVMMLFLVGLELKPSLLWKMRLPILGMGGSQVVGSTLVIFIAGVYFLPWQQSLAVGLILALSSTAIVLQTLNEKGLMNTSPGRSIFSILLFQDLAVIPILAVLPLLALEGAAGPIEGHHAKVLWDISVYPGYIRLLLTLLAIGSIFFIGKYISRPVFKAIAATRVREVFVAAVLALVIGISVLMMLVGLSPALGAFLAGVVLANSEYRHEIESDLEPFKGLLLGIFFISIGASLNFTLISENFLLISGLTVALIFLKWLLLVAVSKAFKLSKKEWSLVALALAQGGEFAFVLFQFSKSNHVLPDPVIDTLVSVVAISMFLTPLFFIVHDKLLSKAGEESAQDQEADSIEGDDHKVILAGFGRMGTDLGRLLLSAKVKPVIIDHDVNNIEILRKYGFEVYYGDITRLDLLESAGASHAELLIITIGELEKSMELIELTKKHYPHLKISVMANSRLDAHELMSMGVQSVTKRTFGSAVSMGKEALGLLGYHPHEAHRLSLIFQKKDQEMMEELSKMYREDDEAYTSLFRQHNLELEQLMEIDAHDEFKAIEKSWTRPNPEK